MKNKGIFKKNRKFVFMAILIGLAMTFITCGSKCPESKDGKHYWILVAGQRLCSYCGEER